MATLEQLKAEHPEWCFTCGKYWLEPGGIHTCHESPLLAALIAAKREDEARIEELESSLRAIFAVSIRHCTPTFNTITDAARAALKGGQP